MLPTCVFNTTEKPIEHLIFSPAPLLLPSLQHHHHNLHFSFNAILVLQGVDTADPTHFITPENIQRLQQAKEANRVQVYMLFSPS